MTGMTQHPIPAPVQVFGIALCCFALAWFRWRQGKTYWLTIAWWTAIAWAIWTICYVAYSLRGG
jgi:hypothetical protein